MIKRLASTLIFLWFVGIHCIYADVTVSGVITDSDGMPVEAMVTLLKNKRILAYTTAGEDGSYAVSTAPSDSIVLRAAYVGYSQYNVTINCTQNIMHNIVMEGGAFALKEVVAVPDKITQHGDTLNFNVSQYKVDGDRVIGDIIKKMPGLEVSNGGKISFNGKEVKNLYVEDMDLLQGRYGIATNNVAAEDVAAVQVYQNHQPIHALADISPSEDVTINLKLKEKAKGTLSINSMVGLGYKPILWSAEANVMYFGRKVQNISVYKGNNEGTDLSKEFNNFSADNLQSTLSPLSVVAPNLPNLPLSRFLKNRSYAVSLNNLWRLNETATMAVNISYFDDVSKKQGESINEQYIPTSEGYRTIAKRIEAQNNTHCLEGSVATTQNSSSLYLSNNIHFKSEWNNDEGLSGTSASFSEQSVNVRQALSKPSFSIKDKFEIIRNLGSNVLDLQINAHWTHHNNFLIVSPSEYIGEWASSKEIRQDYKSDRGSAFIKTGFLKRINKVKLSAMLFSDVDIEKTVSGLYGITESNLTNDYIFGHFNIGIEPSAKYTISDWYFKFILPVKYSYQWINQQVNSGNSMSFNYINLNPELHINYSIGRHWFNIDASYSKNQNNEDRASIGVIMTDYLTFKRSEIDKTLIDDHISGLLSYRYGNPIWQLFGNISLSWVNTSSNVTTGYKYDGFSTVITVNPQPHRSNNYTLLASVNKGLKFWSSTLKLGINSGIYDSKLIIDENKMPYMSIYWSGNISMSINPANWFNANLIFAYSQNKSHIPNSKVNGNTITQWTGGIDMNFVPFRNFMVKVSAENNYVNISSKDKFVWFGDLKFIYQWKRFDYELDVNNIFNRKYYIRLQYDAMNINRSVYSLRERSVMLKIRFKVL